MQLEIRERQGKARGEKRKEKRERRERERESVSFDSYLSLLVGGAPKSRPFTLPALISSLLSLTLAFSSLALISDSNSSKQPRVIEQRFSAFLHSLLLLTFSFLLPIVATIPLGVLWGAFLLLAVEAYGSQFVQRCLLFFTSRKSRKAPAWDNLRSVINIVPPNIINRFTLIQLLLWLAVFVVAVVLKIPFPMAGGRNVWVVVGAVFPAMIAGCAVFRVWPMGKIVEKKWLRVLDPIEEGDEEGGEEGGEEGIDGCLRESGIGEMCGGG